MQNVRLFAAILSFASFFSWKLSIQFLRCWEKEMVFLPTAFAWKLHQISRLWWGFQIQELCKFLQKKTISFPNISNLWNSIMHFVVEALVGVFASEVLKIEFTCNSILSLCHYVFKFFLNVLLWRKHSRINQFNSQNVLALIRISLQY